MILDQFRLDGRVALVTGARRAGQAWRWRWQRRARTSRAGPLRERRDRRGRSTALGRRFIRSAATCEKPGWPIWRRIVAQVVEIGRLDILVNNAGHHPPRAGARIQRGGLGRRAADQPEGGVLSVAGGGRQMVKRQGGGKIINVASMLSFQGGILVPSYTAAKSGVAGITRALANEWARHGINVNAIAPGYMATDNTAPIRADAGSSRVHPGPHPGRPLGRRRPTCRLCRVPGLAGVRLCTAPSSAWTAGGWPDERDKIVVLGAALLAALIAADLCRYTTSSAVDADHPRWRRFAAAIPDGVCH